MDKVKVLDSLLANKIAAGEVVERPSNVVKELVENAIDAHATKIDIYVEEGGINRMIVIDNGDGMSKNDAKNALLRHATSKIHDEHDLMRIATLGFRGEALPSIAVISHLQMETCNGEEGALISSEFGKIKDVTEGLFRKGTKITITKLFQNVPARLKYLKYPQQEYAQIYDIIQKLSLSYPNIAFSLYSDQRPVYKTSGNNQMLEVIAQIYGPAVAKEMIPIKIEDGDFKIDGFISKLSVNRSNKNHIHTLVNQRVIKHPKVVDAINQVYRPYLFDNRHPIAFINISLDYYLIDVNVHPSKWEVRFSKEQQLLNLITDYFGKVLKETNLMYTAPIESSPTVTLENIEPLKFEFTYPEPKPILNQTIAKEFVETEANITANETVVLNVEVKQFEKIHPIGQVHGTYIVASNERGLFLIDQHAAQERILYEYYQNQFSQYDHQKRTDLLVPIMVELSAVEHAIIKDQLHLLSHVGIELMPFGQYDFKCESLPSWMIRFDEKQYVDDMVQAILSGQRKNMLDLQKDAIATLSCKAAIKANRFLTQYEMEVLLDDLMKCETPYTCPHGRPAIIFYSGYDLEKLFKRVI